MLQAEATRGVPARAGKASARRGGARGQGEGGIPSISQSEMEEPAEKRVISGLMLRLPLLSQAVIVIGWILIIQVGLTKFDVFPFVLGEAAESHLRAREMCRPVSCDEEECHPRGPRERRRPSAARRGRRRSRTEWRQRCNLDSVRGESPLERLIG